MKKTSTISCDGPKGRAQSAENQLNPKSFGQQGHSTRATTEVAFSVRLEKNLFLSRGKNICKTHSIILGSKFTHNDTCRSTLLKTTLPPIHTQQFVVGDAHRMGAPWPQHVKGAPSHHGTCGGRGSHSTRQRDGQGAQKKQTTDGRVNTSKRDSR